MGCSNAIFGYVRSKQSVNVIFITPVLAVCTQTQRHVLSLLEGTSLPSYLTL